MSTQLSIPGLEDVYLILVADICNSVFNHVYYRD